MTKIFLVIILLVNNVTTLAQWELISDTLKDIRIIHIKNEEIFCGAAGTVYYSPDNGNTWQNKNNGLKYWSSVVDVTSDDSLIVIGCSGDGVYFSTNNGNSWIEKDSGLTTKNVLNVEFHNHLLFAGEDYNPLNFVEYEEGGLYISEIEGKTWEKITTLPHGDIYKILSFNNNIFVGLIDGMYRSTDNGKSWTKVFNHFVNSIASMNKYIFIASGDSLVCSKDNGETWQRKDKYLGVEYIGEIAVVDTMIFLSDDKSGGKIFVSFNLGENWHSIYTNLSDSSNGFASIAVNKNFLFASFYSGNLWRRPISTITNVESQKFEFPNDFNVYQNYPNPFNPATKIRYSIPIAGHVEIKVYDLLGREISTLLNREQNRGIYEVEFNGINMPGGVYFYRIKAGKYFKTNKMILEK